MSPTISDRSFAFAIKIVHASRHIASTQKEFVLSKQLLRSGSAIAALVSEAKYAESKPDFIHKMGIALKEANETECWLKLLCATGIYEDQELIGEVTEIRKILSAIVFTAKKNLAKHRQSEQKK